MNLNAKEPTPSLTTVRPVTMEPTTSLVVLDARQPATGEKPLAESLTAVKTGRNKEMKFRLFAPWAKSVFLAADFTGWNKSPVKMARDTRGVWHIKISLPPGKHGYRFVVDIDCGSIQGQRQAFPFGTLQGVAEVTA